MMNDNTKPNSASASVNAMPRNIVVRTVPADSGCLAMAVMAFPTTIPMPMPGPMAAPPYTIPRPMAVRPLASSPACCAASRKSCNESLLRRGLVLRVHRQADIHTRQDREDERLQRRDQDLERRQRDEQGERERGADLEVDGRPPDRRRQDGERDQDQVAGEHVGEEPDGERERPHEEHRDELDEHQQRQDDLRDVGRDDRALDVVPKALPRDPDDVEHEPDEDRQEDRDRDPCVPGELDERQDLEDVDEEDEEEHRRQEREVTHSVGTDGLQDDPLAHEVDARLGHVLDAAGYELVAAGGVEEEGQSDQDRREVDEDRLVDRERGAAEPDVGPPRDMRDRREVDAEQRHCASSFRALIASWSRRGPGAAREKLTERSSQNSNPRWAAKSVSPSTTMSAHPNNACATTITSTIESMRRRNPPRATAISAFPDRRVPHSRVSAATKKLRRQTPRPRAALAAPSTPRSRPATSTTAGAISSPWRVRSRAMRFSTGGGASTASPPPPA